MILSCLISLSFTLSAQNPYLPLWEFIPDGEPYVFEDPDCPGKYRVYIYGSHDNLKWMYCGRDQVVWSAPIEDLTRWRYDGVIFKVNESPELYKLNADGTDDVLFAPDVTVTTDTDGKKTYYLFPNNQGSGRNSMIAKSDRPDGPFTVCNWNKERPRETFGCLGFDPAVFVDDDGRVYGYWGFGISHGAELDPATMCTVKPGTEVVENMISGYRQEGIFRFLRHPPSARLRISMCLSIAVLPLRVKMACRTPATIRWHTLIASILWVPGPMAEQSSMPVRASMMKKAM